MEEDPGVPENIYRGSLSRYLVLPQWVLSSPTNKGAGVGADLLKSPVLILFDFLLITPTQTWFFFGRKGGWVLELLSFRVGEGLEM